MTLTSKVCSGNPTNFPSLGSNLFLLFSSLQSYSITHLGVIDTPDTKKAHN